MSKNEILSGLLERNLNIKMEGLEKRFEREGMDISTLEITMDTMKKTLKNCEILSEEAALAAEKAKEKMNSSRMNTEPNSTKNTPSIKGRDKSLGPDKGMSKTKTTGNLKTIDNSKGLRRDQSTRAMSKNKSSSNLTEGNEMSGKKTLNKTMTERKLIEPKTPKAMEKKPTARDMTKGLSKTPSKVMKKTEDTKSTTTIKRTPTTKALNTPVGEKDTKKPIVRTATKGNLKDNKSSNNVTKVKDDKPENGEEEKTEELKKTRREINVSGIIGVESTPSNEDLLTKEDPLIVSSFQDKTETVNVTKSEPKVDFSEVLDDRWNIFSRYFNRPDHIKIIVINKNFGKLSINQLIGDVQKDIIENETKIKALREKYQNDDLTKEQAAFALTRGALKAIELLNENIYNKIFTEGVVPQDDIILIYRIFFQLLGRQDLVDVQDTKEFWDQTCNYFITEGQGKAGNMIQGLVKDLVFTNENIHKLFKLVGSNLNKITPAYFSKICGTTGLIIFLVKDAFEYSGILIDKKTPPSRLYKNYMYTFEVLQSKIERLKKIQSQFFS